MKKMMGNYSGKLQQLLCLLICVLMVVVVSIRRDGKVAGRYVNQQQSAKKHRIDGERMRQRQIEARYHHDAYNIDEQRKSLRQEKAVATDE